MQTKLEEEVWRGNREQRVAEILEEIAQLPRDWHLAGTMSRDVLSRMAAYMTARDVACSMETGTGKTTLLFSHLSRHHKVFAKRGDDRSVEVVEESPLLNKEKVEFIEGPTQQTLPQHRFQEKVQVALIDGPHGYPFPELEYYFIYPHLDVNGLLMVDDIHIPTIHRLFEFLREDEMFRFLEVVGTTAFFERTDAPVFNPLGDGWWLQRFNTKRHPFGPYPKKRNRWLSWVPRPIKQRLKRALRR